MSATATAADAAGSLGGGSSSSELRQRRRRSSEETTSTGEAAVESCNNNVLWDHVDSDAGNSGDFICPNDSGDSRNDCTEISPMKTSSTITGTRSKNRSSSSMSAQQVKKDESRFSKIVIRVVFGACMFAVFSGLVRLCRQN